MKKFGKWIARYALRPKFSYLWWVAGVVCGLSYAHIGLWAILWLFLSSFPISFLEVWWNEYADDYDDLETDA